jgi:hypothetical protein
LDTPLLPHLMFDTGLLEYPTSPGPGLWTVVPVGPHKRHASAATATFSCVLWRCVCKQWHSSGIVPASELELALQRTSTRPAPLSAYQPRGFSRSFSSLCLTSLVTDRLSFALDRMHFFEDVRLVPIVGLDLNLSSTSAKFSEYHKSYSEENFSVVLS